MRRAAPSLWALGILLWGAVGQEPVEEWEEILTLGKSSCSRRSHRCTTAGCPAKPAPVLREEQGRHFLVLGCIRIENNHGWKTKPAQLNGCKSSGRHGLQPCQAAPTQMMASPAARHVCREGCWAGWAAARVSGLAKCLPGTARIPQPPSNPPLLRDSARAAPQQSCREKTS